MTGYQTVVVGTDGSGPSLRAVERAGAIAAASNAKLVLATRNFPTKDDERAADILGDAGYKMHGNAPIYEILHDAREQARAAGATNIDERPIQGSPVGALVGLAGTVRADLLVVDDVGLGARSALVGRMLSIAGSVSSRSPVDVLIVHATD